MAREVKKGVMQLDLESKNTYQVPYDGKYYYLTFVEEDKKLFICKIEDVLEEDLEDLYVKMNNNKEFFESNFGDE